MLELDGYSLTIDDKDMFPYVDASRMRAFRQRAEGSKMWEYWTDAITVVLDKSCFNDLGINENTYTTLYKKSAVIRQFGKLLLDGAVMKVRYDWDNEELVLGLHSGGRIIKNIQLGEGYHNLHVEGDTAEFIVAQIGRTVNNRLDEQGYPFRVKGTRTDTQDFSFYRSLITSTLDIPARKFKPWKSTKNVIGIYKDVRRRSPYYGKYFLVYKVGGNVNYGVPIKSSGLTDGYIKETSTEYLTQWVPVDELPKGAKEIIAEQLGFSENYEFLGSVAFGESYYLLVRDTGNSAGDMFFINTVIDQTDKFIFNYTRNVTAGQALTDITKLKNAVLHIASDGKIYVQARSGFGSLDAKSATNLSSQVIEKTAEFEIPEAYIMLQSVRDDVNEFFNARVIGRFIWARAVFDRQEFAPADFPLMMKKLPIRRTINNGIINSVQYEGDNLVIETEEYLEN